MKLKITDYCKTPEQFKSIETYAEYKLDGADYGQSALEDVVATARNNSKAIGRLLDLLAEKDLITAEEVGTIIEGFTYHDKIEFIKCS